MEQWIIRSQVLQSTGSMDAVQRPNGGGGFTKNKELLRYGPIPCRNAKDKRNSNGMAVLSWWSDLSG